MCFNIHENICDPENYASFNRSQSAWIPFITNVDEEDFVVDGITNMGIKFASVIFQDVEVLIFPFRFEYSYETDEYTCYSKHFSDEIVEDELRIS